MNPSPVTTALLIDASLFKSLEIAKQIDKYTCAICNTICREAVESSCGHLFCQVCIEKWLEKKAECGMCRAPILPSKGGKRKWELHPALFVRRQIAALELNCCHKECTWSGQLGLNQEGLDNHLQHFCEFHPRPCPFDEDHPHLTRSRQYEHEQECQCRPIQCHLCDKTIQFKELGHHLVTACPQVLIPCPMECQRHLTRGLLATHLKDECPNQDIPCVFTHFGCQYTCVRKLMVQHELEAIKQHHALLLVNTSIKINESLDAEYKNAIAPGIVAVNSISYRLVPRLRSFSFYQRVDWWLHVEPGDLVRYKNDYVILVMAREPERLYALRLPLHSGCHDDVSKLWLYLTEMGHFATNPLSLLGHHWYPTLATISKWDLVPDATHVQYLVPPSDFEHLWRSVVDLDSSEESDLEEEVQ